MFFVFSSPSPDSVFTLSDLYPFCLSRAQRASLVDGAMHTRSAAIARVSLRDRALFSVAYIFEMHHFLMFVVLAETCAPNTKTQENSTNKFQKHKNRYLRKYAYKTSKAEAMLDGPLWRFGPWRRHEPCTMLMHTITGCVFYSRACRIIA